MKDMEKKITDYLRQRKEVVAAYLFGSYAADRERAMSDVDIAVLLDAECVPQMSEAIEEYGVDLGRLLRRDLHIVALNTAGEGILREVFTKGKCIVVNDANELSHFRTHSYARIADFSRYKVQAQQGLINKVKELSAT